jgi:hypothetical protein
MRTSSEPAPKTRDGQESERMLNTGVRMQENELTRFQEVRR